MEDKLNEQVAVMEKKLVAVMEGKLNERVAVMENKLIERLTVLLHDNKRGKKK